MILCAIEENLEENDGEMFVVSVFSENGIGTKPKELTPDGKNHVCNLYMGQSCRRCEGGGQKTKIQLKGVIMNYADTLQAINPMSAMKALGLEATIHGAYLNFPCKCEKSAVIKAYGEKKNLIYCPSCKSASHIIKLTMEKKSLDWEGAKKFLKEYMPTDKVITQKLSFEYDLQYTNQLEAKGLTKEFCKRMGIGRPQGKTMLAGCIAFLILDRERDPIAYYGIRIKDQRPVFHKSFNPELYLYGYNNIDDYKEVFFTTDIWKCLNIIQKGGAAVCNFGLPYLSTSHTEMLQKFQAVLYVKDDNITEIKKQVLKMDNFFKFVE